MHDQWLGFLYLVEADGKAWAVYYDDTTTTGGQVGAFGLVLHF